MANSMKLIKMHEIAVISKSEQFHWVSLHEENPLAGGHHFVNFRMTT